MNRIDLAGHVAVVTGAARGIGYAIAERFLQSGASVSLWDMDGEALAQAERNLGVHGKVGRGEDRDTGRRLPSDRIRTGQFAKAVQDGFEDRAVVAGLRGPGDDL